MPSPVGIFKTDSRLRLFGIAPTANNLVQFINSRVLFVNRELGVANNVDEQDMRDLKLDFFFNFGGHASFGAADSASFWKRGSFRSGSNIGSSRSSAGVSVRFPVTSALLDGIDSSFCKAAMARSGSPICAATRRGSRSHQDRPPHLSRSGPWPWPARLEQGGGFVTKTHIGQREIANERNRFSGCSLRKDSSSLRACRQLSWAAACSPATSCAQPNQKRSSPLM